MSNNGHDYCIVHLYMQITDVDKAAPIPHDGKRRQPSCKVKGDQDARENPIDTATISRAAEAKLSAHEADVLIEMKSASCLAEQLSSTYPDKDINITVGSVKVSATEPKASSTLLGLVLRLAKKIAKGSPVT